jgi:type IV pilus assembly protein PilC
MGKFKYKALTKDGRKVNGNIEASSKESAIDTLHKQGFTPLVVKDGAKKGEIAFLTSKKVKSKEIVVFTRQMSTMISAGVPLTKAMATLEEQTDSAYFKQVINNLSKDIEGGTTIGDAMAKYPNVFDEVYVNMVKAGEAGGILDDILKRLAIQAEKNETMKKKIKSAMTYPTVISFIAVGAFFAITMFILPQIGKVLKDLGGPDKKLPPLTQFMLSMSDFMQNNAVIIIIFLVVGIFLLRKYIKTPKGQYKFHGLLLKIPVVKDVVTKIAVARFARTFSSLLSSGVSVLEAIKVTSGAIGNKVIEKELNEAAKAVQGGHQLSEPILQSKHFPKIVGQMLAIGEETGEIDQILVKVADFYEEEVETMIDGLSSIIEPVMIVALGGMVGLLAASVMGPLASVGNSISTDS